MKSLQHIVIFAVLTVVVLVNFLESAKILSIMPTPSFSHQIVFQPLWKKLLLKGHEVTLLTTDPIKDSNFSNFRQIDWSFAYELWHTKYNYSNMVKNFRHNKIKSFFEFVQMMHEIVIQELEHRDVQSLINNKSEHFDLVIVEILHPTMTAFSERFKCPFIGISSMDATTFGHDIVGNPTNPAVYTDFLTPYDSKMSFFERVLNTVHYIGTTLFFHYYFYPMEDLSVKKYFGDGLPTLKYIQKKVSMIFINTHPVLHEVRPLMPNVFQIGGAIHLHKLKTLPKDLETFLNRSQEGVIYFSLGSNIMVSDLSKDTVNTLIETFTKLPYYIVWKMETSILVKNVSNIFIAQWLPQQEILAHKNVKLFITQGGQQSLEEAIFYGVPVIGIPFCVDQFANIRRLSKKGVCLELNAEHLNAHELENAIYEVINNESYKNSAKELSTLLRDQPISSLERAVWWTEYVIRHKGANVLRSEESYNIPFYEYFLLDVIGTFIIVTTLFIFVLYKFILVLVKCICKKKKFKCSKTD